MKLIIVAILFVVAAWLGTYAGHWANKKAVAAADRPYLTQIEEATR